MICFGVANTMAAAFAGALAKFTGRFPMMIGTMLLHGGLMLYMRFWIAVNDDYWSYCSMAAVWGLADGIWLVQVNCKFVYVGCEVVLMECSSLFSNLWHSVPWERRGSVQ